MSWYILGAVGGGSIEAARAGGVITQALNWHWIFLINLPIGAVAFGLGALLVRENEGLGLGRGSGPDRLDPRRAAGLDARRLRPGQDQRLRLGIGANAGRRGAAIALMVAFFVLESRLRKPIMPPRILRVHGLFSSSLVRGFLFTRLFGSFFIGTLYFEHVPGYDALHTGLAFMPTTLVVSGYSAGVTARLVRPLGAPPHDAAGDGAHGRRPAALPPRRAAHGVLPDHLRSVHPDGGRDGNRVGAAADHRHVGGALWSTPGWPPASSTLSMQAAAAIGVARVRHDLRPAHQVAARRPGHSLPSALTGGYQLALVVAALRRRRRARSSRWSSCVRRGRPLPGVPVVAAPAERARRRRLHGVRTLSTPAGARPVAWAAAGRLSPVRTRPATACAPPTCSCSPGTAARRGAALLPLERLSGRLGGTRGRRSAASRSRRRSPPSRPRARRRDAQAALAGAATRDRRLDGRAGGALERAAARRAPSRVPGGATERCLRALGWGSPPRCCCWGRRCSRSAMSGPSGASRSSR